LKNIIGRQLGSGYNKYEHDDKENVPGSLTAR